MLKPDVMIAPWAVWERRPRSPTPAKRSSSTPRSSPASSGGFAVGLTTAGSAAISGGRAARVNDHVRHGAAHLPEAHVEARVAADFLEARRADHLEPGPRRRAPPGTPGRVAAVFRGVQE